MIWAIVLLLALLLTDFRNGLVYALQGLESTTLIVLLVLTLWWYR